MNFRCITCRLAAWPLGRLAAWPLGRLAAWPLGRLAAWLATFAFSSASFALAPYDSIGATIELVPVAGGGAVATTHVAFPPDAATLNLAIPSSLISAMAPGAPLSFFAWVTSDVPTQTSFHCHLGTRAGAPAARRHAPLLAVANFE